MTQAQAYTDTRRFRSTAVTYMDPRPYENSAMLIFKFDWMRTDKEDWQTRPKLRTRIQADCKLMAAFKIEFINKFSPSNFDELRIYTHWQNAYHRQDPNLHPPKKEYEKDWLFDQYEIGFDLIHKEYGVRNENHWGSWYVLIPKVETEMVKWMLENKPYFVRVMKRI